MILLPVIVLLNMANMLMYDMKGVKIILLGIASILFGRSFAFFGGEGVLITLFLASVGLIVCVCGLLFDSDKKGNQE